MIDRRTFQVVRWLKGLDSTRGRLFFSPDSQHIVLEAPDLLSVHNVLTGDEEFRRQPSSAAHVKNWNTCFYLPDGRLAAIGKVEQPKAPRQCMLWDVAADKLIWTFEPAQTLGDELAVSVDGSRLFLRPASRAFGWPAKASKPNPERLYELPSGRLLAELPRPEQFQDSYMSIDGFTVGGKLVLSRGIPMGTKANVNNAYWLVQAMPSADEVLRVPNRCMADDANGITPDGRYLALGNDRGEVELWDIESRSMLWRYTPHGGKTIQFLSISPEGDIATLAEDDDRLVVLRMKEVAPAYPQWGWAGESLALTGFATSNV